MSSAEAPPASVRSVAAPAWLAAAAAVVLGVSYTLPTVTFRTITSKESEVYSIWGGIVSLWRDGNVVLAPIVFLFSIAFPIAKLLLIGWVFVARPRAGRATGVMRGPRDPHALVAWLRLLGKWSMLDVLIVGLFVGSIRIGIATASSRPGIVVFAAAIVLSMLAAHTLERALATLAEATPEASPARPNASRWLGRGVSLLATVAVVAAVTQPLLIVSKGFFFSNEVGLWSTARAMVTSSERVLGGALLACVALLALLRAAASLGAWWSPRGHERLGRIAGALDEWAMLDVFALALAIVHVKLEELTTTRLSFGFWAVFGAGALSILDAWLLRRRLLARNVEFVSRRGLGLRASAR